jgi:PhzF family phenazine biosynthesis protein
MRRRFQQVDVFAAEPLRGNPVAVVLNADGLPADEMQRLARWTNLSETTFVQAPTTADADYRVRIFTPAEELPFAGHPTLGTCHAWLAAGGRPDRPDRVVQECGAGLVQVRRDRQGRLAFQAPDLVRSGPADEALVGRLAAVLGITRDDIVDVQWVDNGPGWVAVRLRDAGAVLAVEPDASQMPPGEDLKIGLVGLYPLGGESAVEVRALFRADQGALREDPVTGSLNASVAQWLLASGRVTAPYVASQGTRLGRRGRPRIEQDADGAVWVGGHTVTVIDGHLDLAGQR